MLSRISTAVWIVSLSLSLTTWRLECAIAMGAMLTTFVRQCTAMQTMKLSKTVAKGKGQSERAAQRAATKGVAKREPQRARQARRHFEGSLRGLLLTRGIKQEGPRMVSNVQAVRS